MLTEYRMKVVRNEVRRVIGKFNDDELRMFVEGIYGFLNGYDQSSPSLNKKERQPLKRPNKNETTRY
tara:strand:+ start:452 stop:652 length:201 start_codon:yes stop_codon:yes gene_type:complete